MITTEQKVQVAKDRAAEDTTDSKFYHFLVEAPKTSTINSSGEKDE